MLASGLGLLSLAPSFGLAFRHHVISRAANRLYFCGCLSFLDAHVRTATSPCHFFGIFWHFEILSVRIADKRVVSMPALQSVYENTARFQRSTDVHS